MSETLFDKIWNSHLIDQDDDGNSLIYIDRILVHDLTFHAFNHMRKAGRKIRRPETMFSFADHFVPTRNRTPATIDPDMGTMVQLLKKNSQEFGIRSFGLDDPDQGILHVVGPEQGLTQPGLVIAGADSHTSTHGALGAFAFGAGVSDIVHAAVTQSLWRPRPRNLRIQIDGALHQHVSAKDVILAIIARIGAGGGTGHVIEYTGSTIEAMSVEARMTICNMSIEAGARAGLVSPDDKSIDYVRGRPMAPAGDLWDSAERYWRALATDANASFDTSESLSAADIEPMVTWGTSPEDALPISGHVPDPAKEPNPARRLRLERSLQYIGLDAGQAVQGIPVDHVFIGSCTNARIEDLRVAADIARSHKARIPAMVVPGSSAVKRQAEAEGLDAIFRESGFQWLESGCSMCVAINGDHLAAGTRCASTSNRNFQGRQGKGARTHLVSPAMAAAAAVTGQLTDVRNI